MAPITVGSTITKESATTVSKVRARGIVLPVIAVLTVWGLSACGGTQSTKTVTTTTTVTSVPATATAAPSSAKERSKRKTRTASAMRTCDANITARRATTSCRFAENVFYGYWKAQDQGDDAFTAYSPVTKQTYSMSCSGETTVICRAGDGGEVHFPMAAVRAYTAENAAHYAATHDTGPASPSDEGSANPGDDGGSDSGSDCDPNYEGQCLDPNSADYDCEDGSGNGPDYTGPVTVVGDDHFDLDRDGDGSACE
jgi:hypothetical protein